MKIIIAGATGTASSEVLVQAIADDSIEKTCVLSKRNLDIENSKLEIILLKDFFDYSKIKRLYF